ncbi:MAG: PleD family two-component system response regulator [Marinicellaceae bacterium]
MTNTKLKALVVEDSIVTQRLISIFLTRMGFEVVFIDNGVEALKLLKENHFDIIFLDVIMPEVSGYSVCKFIKSSMATKSIPVIMLTSKDGMFDKVKGRMSGADVYLVKPINHRELVKAVSKFYPISNGELQISYKKEDNISKENPSMQHYPKPNVEFPKKGGSQKDQNTNKIISIADTIRKSRIN